MPHEPPVQIICLQTRLTQYHYRSYSTLKDYLLNSIGQSHGTRPTLVVLPECIGAWLYLMCVPMPAFLRHFFFREHETSRCRHLLFIVFALITHMRVFFKELCRNYATRKSWLGLIQRSWFGLHSQRTHALYRQLFSELARETNTIIVAGSLFSRDPSDVDALYSVSYVFEPVRGSVCLESGKYYRVADESAFVDRYARAPTIYSIPGTNVDLGVLICADSWMPEIYQLYGKIPSASNRRFLFVIVALNLGRWDIPWPGYDAHCPLPADVQREHLRTYSLGQAWRSYAIDRAFNALEQRQIHPGYGVVCCQGALNIMNDICGEGESMLLMRRAVHDERFFLQGARTLTCEF